MSKLSTELDYFLNQKVSSPNHRALKPGERIKPGDEFKRHPGCWVPFTETCLNQYKEATGKPVCYEKGNLPVRRKI